MRRWFAGVYLALVILPVYAGQLSDCSTHAAWPAWEQAQRRLVSAEGRVVDVSDERRITTSEGQSYALFFALVNNDVDLFRKLLQWTQNHLAEGDLSARLPAWLWGEQTAGRWGVIDSNSAADSDLWIAYTLLEAGRLWKEFGYTLLGTQMLHNIARAEVAVRDEWGPMLLPGGQGFVQEGNLRLNPSYLPPQLITRAALAVQGEPWASLNALAPRFLMSSAPNGIAPDWISWTGSRFEAFDQSERTGSYDAIRVYLWIGMLNDDAAQALSLKAHFRSIARYIDEQGWVAEHIDTETGASGGEGPPGFSAALLPLFTGLAEQSRLERRLDAVQNETLGYYSQMLFLFGQGWAQQRYGFDPQGRLIPAWKECP